MPLPLQRKTHPMVLTAAAAVTIFSVLGSAAVTGLIPNAHSGYQENPSPESASNSRSYGKASSRAELPKADESERTTSSHDSRPASVERPPVTSTTPSPSAKSSTCKSCGVIESIRTTKTEGDGSGLGAVAGGVAGGVLGNQIGKGKGNTLMTLIGIGGGAYAGHTIEKNMNSSQSYLVKVRMENGSYRIVTQYSEPKFAVGDHVRVANGSISST